MLGVLNINKPKGVTSSNVVVKIKKLLNIKKVGHMGTLDPLAQGVLPICIGKATRLFDYFLKKQKTYIAQFKFGEETDTLDLEGKIVKTSSYIPTKQDIAKALTTFIGEISQIPPMYSSKKIDGKKAYDLARQGETIEMKPCNVTIYDYKLLHQVDDKTFEFLITCSAGTYIRCLARDLGQAVNSCATMVSLIRTNSGPFNIENAIDYNSLTEDALKENLMSLDEVLADFEKLFISKEDFQRLLNGLNVFSNIKDNINYAVICENQIIGIGEVKNNQLKLKTFLAEI